MSGRRDFLFSAAMALCLALSTGIGAPAAQARDALAGLGPKVGTPIPHQLTVKDQNGTAQQFGRLTGKRGLILLFSRSLGW